MYLGLDIGRSGLKGVGEERLFLLPICTPVTVPPVHPLVIEPMARGTRVRLVHVAYQGNTWLLGEDAERPGGRGHYRMDLVKGGAHHALLVVAGAGLLVPPEQEGAQIQVAVGVPVAFFVSEAASLRQLIGGVHTVTLGARTCTLELHGLVVPEGLGLLMAAAMRKSGCPDLTFLSQVNVVLDFGHRTTHLLALQGMAATRRVTTLPSAVSDVFEGVIRTELEAPLRTVFEAPQKAQMIARLLLDGQVRVRRLELTLEGLRERLLEEARAVWPRLREEIRQALVGVPYTHVVAGGGGVHLFREGLRELFDARELIELDDRYAQAEGYKWLLEHRAALRGHYA